MSLRLITEVMMAPLERRRDQVSLTMALPYFDGSSKNMTTRDVSLLDKA